MMLPHVENTYSWSDDEEHIGEVRVVHSIDLRTIGEPERLGITKLINKIINEMKNRGRTVTDIDLRVVCIVSELKKGGFEDE